MSCYKSPCYPNAGLVKYGFYLQLRWCIQAFWFNFHSSNTWTKGKFDNKNTTKYPASSSIMYSWFSVVVIVWWTPSPSTGSRHAPSKFKTDGWFVIQFTEDPDHRSNIGIQRNPTNGHRNQKKRTHSTSQSYRTTVLRQVIYWKFNFCMIKKPQRTL